ncbi:uncharacterized protein LOC102631503 isoform 2 [Mus musculus]|uniref:uncharacterized protein LOC102631503 isoform 2 n=1 Tax=Mus musculus TaxID=10090 RepID=UPI0007EE1491|nr:uncharacterized protein LOC102631503 isoform 2 [Mus musculus]|eukprot:XP_017169221.1 PREDICTED: uncharacterized protein Gm29825 isoform X2 [Mus musculus]
MGNCCDTRVLPQECTDTPFSTDDRPRTKSSLTVGSRKRRNIFTIVRNIHHKNPVVPMEAEEHQAPTSSSIQKPQNETKAKHGDGTTSEEDEEKSPLRRVKVASKRSQHRIPFLRNKCRRGSLLPMDAQECDFIDTSCEGKPQNNLEVVAECSDGAALPVDKGKGPVKMAEATSKKRRCVSAILKKFSRRRVVAPIKLRRPVVLPGTSKETAPVTTEVVPENADSAPSARGQKEPPVGMVKEETKKRRHIFSILRGICHKTTVVPQDTQRPPVSKATSTKATEIKAKDIPENNETMESVEERKQRRISALLKRVEEKQAMAPPEVCGPQVCNIPSPKTNVRHDKENATAASPLSKDHTSQSVTMVEPKGFKFSSVFRKFYRTDSSPPQAPEKPSALKGASKETQPTIKTGSQCTPEIKEIFCKKEEFEYHDEGSWEEYQSYFPHGIHVPDSRQTIASTLIGSCIAEVGDTDMEKEQNTLDSTENFPEAIEVQQWELRKTSNTVAPAVNVLFLAPPTSSDDEEYYTPIKRKKRRKKRRRYY